MDGRPVWEPPVLSYDHLIGDEYEQKRKAVLKYTNGDVVKTTEILDINDEIEILGMYLTHVSEDQLLAKKEGDMEKMRFFDALQDDVWHDRREAFRRWKVGGAFHRRNDDGTYEIEGIRSLETLRRQAWLALSLSGSHSAARADADSSATSDESDDQECSAGQELDSIAPSSEVQAARTPIRFVVGLGLRLEAKQRRDESELD